MLKKNNGDPAVCINNLLQTARGEVPYDRVKGVGIDGIASPIDQSSDEIVDDAEWMLGTYEPRVEVDSVEAIPSDVMNGHFELKANIKAKEADT